MLDKPVDEIVYENGKVVGVKSQGEVSICVFQLLYLKQDPLAFFNSSSPSLYMYVYVDAPVRLPEQTL